MTTTTTTGHQLRRLEQVPNRRPDRYPTHATWVCECGVSETLRARWGTQTDTCLSAHAAHARAALETPTLFGAMLETLPPIQQLMLEGGRATHDGHPCKFTILGEEGLVWLELDAPKTPDGPTSFTGRLAELEEVVWNFPDTGAVRILALEEVMRSS